MKRLMLGNHAAALALWHAGCDFVSSYPGTPSTEITERAATLHDIYCEWAPNEKVALESAFGACLAGHRAAAAQKHVGLNVAADPLFTASYTGVNAGLVIFVADDPGLHSSQNEQDSRHYARAAKVPMLEPATPQEIFDFTCAAFALSEQFDSPVIIRLSTRVAHSQGIVDATGERRATSKPYAKNVAKYVMVPAFAKERHSVVEKRLADFAAFAEQSNFNSIELNDPDCGFIASASAYLYLKELCPNASFLKLGIIFPLPADLIRRFASSVNRLIVAEELDPFIENHVKALGIPCEGKSLFPMCGEFSPNLIAKSLGLPTPDFVQLDEPITPRPPVMCAGCPHRGLFYALNKLKCTVLGDIGCYTLAAMPPLAALDSTLCMGASIGMAHGFLKSGLNAVAVIGDSTFIHSGITALANVAYNQSNATVIILDNSITGMTGHQQNPATGLNINGEPAGKVDLESLCRALGINRVRVVDPYNLHQCQTAIGDELNADEPSVIISRRPCALLKHVKHNPPLHVDNSKCIGCKQCLKLGCPAISFSNRKAVVDQTQCTGCNLCAQICPKGAFLRD